MLPNSNNISGVTRRGFLAALVGASAIAAGAPSRFARGLADLVANGSIPDLAEAKNRAVFFIMRGARHVPDAGFLARQLLAGRPVELPEGVSVTVVDFGEGDSLVRETPMLPSHGSGDR